MNRRMLFPFMALCVISAHAANQIVKPAGDPHDPGPMPRKNRKGMYECMLESMKRRQVTEPQKSRRFTRWGDPAKVTFQSHVYWSIELDYEGMTVFGKLESHVHALIRDGVVHLWMYRDSGEIVP